MKIHPDYSQHELYTKAESSIAESNYIQALEYYEELMDLMPELSEEDKFGFYSGAYLELIYKTGNYANMLADCGYYLPAKELINALLSRHVVVNDATISDWLNKLENECIRNVLFSRSSSKINDAIFCCTEKDMDDVQQPITAALHKLGVSVKPDPYIIPIERSDVSFKEILSMTDALIIAISPSLFTSNWPKEELYKILKNTGEDSIHIIPIWHSITRAQVLTASESLEKILAFDTGTADVSKIACGIADILRPDLASGALNKKVWASMLQSKTMVEGVTDFSIPLRHEELDEDLVARIRLIRAAFLDGNRQPMKSWIYGFSCELEPHTAVSEWEKLAYIFQEIRITLHHIKILEDQGLLYKKVQGNWIVDLVTKHIHLFVELTSIPIDKEDDILNQVISYFLELENLPSETLFKFVWISSQPILWEVYGSDDQRIIKFIWSIFFNTLTPLIEPVDDWVADNSARNARKGDDMSFNPLIEAWDPIAAGIVDSKNLREGILHTEEERPWSKEWDIFISHASEDKSGLVRPLAEALKEYGVKVWYDSFTLEPGLSLGDSIFTGINNAEFGIVVLSPSFIKKDWPRREYESLQKRQYEQGDRLITLWHQLAPEERPEWIMEFDSSKSLSTADLSLTQLTMLVLERIRPDIGEFVQKQLNHRNKIDEVHKGQIDKTPINFKDIKIDTGPRKYERLPQGLVDRVRLIRSVIYESYTCSMEYWLEGFLRDHNPELQIEYWQEIASMYQEAIMLFSYQDKFSKKGWSKFFNRKQHKIENREVFHLIQLLKNFPEKPETLKILQEYPEGILNSIKRIVSSRTVIDILDDD